QMVTAMTNTDEEIMDLLVNNYRYDQLQRIKAMDVFSASNVQQNNDFDNAILHNGGAYQTRYSFDKNGNLKHLTRNGSGLFENGASGNNLEMDVFDYFYYEVPELLSSVLDEPKYSNRLGQVKESGADNYWSDIKEGQSEN